jgi:hypothetical protein
LFKRKNYQSIDEVIRETEIINKVREIVEKAGCFEKQGFLNQLKQLPAFKIKPLLAGMPHRKTFPRQGTRAGYRFKEAGFLNGRQ